MFLTDFDRWPTWNPDVKSMSVSEAAAPGAGFKWKSGPASITSTIQRVEPPTLIAWTGKTFGASATHVYRLAASDRGTVVQHRGVVRRLARTSLTRLDAEDS